jgi:hypothetical protein
MRAGGPAHAPRAAPALRSVCTVWFYNPDKECVTGANVVNKLVAGLSPPFCHVELQLPDGEACSIVMHGTVRMRQRTFDTDYYTGVVLRAPPQAVAKTRALAQRHVAARTPFGVTGGHTFCSKLVAELLRDGGVVSAEALPPAALISPSALYQQLTRMPNVVVLPHPQAAVSAPTPAVSFAGDFGAPQQRCAPRLRLGSKV